MPNRRTGRTRRALQQALFALLQEKHYDAITIADVTARADVGRTTFYLHDPHKEALFLDIHAQLVHAQHGEDDRLLNTDEPSAGTMAYDEALRQLGRPHQVMPAPSDSESGQLLQALQRYALHNLDVRVRATGVALHDDVPIAALVHALAGVHAWLVAYWLQRPTHQRNTPAPLLDAAGMARLGHWFQRPLLDAAQRPNTP